MANSPDFVIRSCAAFNYKPPFGYDQPTITCYSKAIIILMTGRQITDTVTLLFLLLGVLGYSMLREIQNKKLEKGGGVNQSVLHV